VNLGVVPVDQFTVHPYLFSLVKGHISSALARKPQAPSPLRSSQYKLWIINVQGILKAVFSPMTARHDEASSSNIGETDQTSEVVASFAVAGQFLRR
jgi:hypothetical protein